MDRGEKSTKPIKDYSKHWRYGKYFVVFLVIVAVILSGSYFAFAYSYQGKSLPNLTFFGRNVGDKTSYEIKNTIEQVASNIDSSKSGVKIKFPQETVSKTFNELGLKIDQSKTVDKIYKFGKIDGFFPSYIYLAETLYGKIKVKQEFSWSQDSAKTLSDLVDKGKTDPENPKINVSDTGFDIQEGKAGQTIDMADLKAKIEKCFVEICSAEITPKSAQKKANFTAQDLSPFKEDMGKIIDSKLSMQNGSKRVNPDREQLAKFIDLEMTSLNQKLTLSDKEIENYLNSISGKFTQKAKNKKISTVDNSVIDEGREGTQLDIKPSIENIKKALMEGSRVAQLEVTTSDPKEEFISPGNNPGKYPGKFIEVNLSEQNLYQFEGTNLIATYRVSTGKWSMPTPQGEFSINNKDPRAYSQEYGLYMPYWMSFIGSQYGIHELPEWPDGTKEGEGHLGTPVSHGCIRLGRGAAEAVYNWAEVGTPVYVHK